MICNKGSVGVGVFGLSSSKFVSLVSRTPFTGTKLFVELCVRIGLIPVWIEVVGSETDVEFACDLSCSEILCARQLSCFISCICWGIIALVNVEWESRAIFLTIYNDLYKTYLWGIH